MSNKFQEQEEFYGNLLGQLCNEGATYYIQHYTDGREFAHDKELFAVFQKAVAALEGPVAEFEKLLKIRIIQNGGDVSDWEF